MGVSPMNKLLSPDLKIVSFGWSARYWEIGPISLTTEFSSSFWGADCSGSRKVINPSSYASKRGERPEWPLVASPHAVVEIKNVHLDLIPRIVPREVSHFQHVYDAARISIAPFDKLVQNMIEV
jgi:hypothetical protein